MLSEESVVEDVNEMVVKETEQQEVPSPKLKTPQILLEAFDVSDNSGSQKKLNTCLSTEKDEFSSQIVNITVKNTESPVSSGRKSVSKQQTQDIPDMFSELRPVPVKNNIHDKIKKDVDISIQNLFKKAIISTSIRKKRVQTIGYTGNENEKSCQTKISGAIKALFDDNDYDKPTKVVLQENDDGDAERQRDNQNFG